MPIYEYRCRKCGKVIEHFAWSTNVVAEMECKCGATATRIMSCPGGIKIGDLVMSVIKRGRPDESADENWYRSAQVAEAKNMLPHFNSPEQKRYAKYIQKKAKQEGW